MINSENIQKWGFGAAPISERMRLRYDSAVSIGLLVAQSNKPHPCEHLNDISELKGMFNRCVRKDQWDWFSVHAAFGRPPHSVCVRIARLLAGYRKALKNDETEHAAHLKRQLEHSELFHCLTAYTGDNKLQDESIGYLYVLSTRDQPDVLKIGMTTRTPEKRIKEINSATGLLYPYSARKIVELYNAADIEKLVHSKLDEFRIRKDREFFRMPFVDAAECIDLVVQEHGIRPRADGMVKTFLADKGFGFMTMPNGTDVFFHVSSWPKTSRENILQGTNVSFRIVNTANGATARDIKLENDNAGNK